MERQFGPFKKGDLVRFRHQDGHALGVVIEAVYYPESRINSFCWVAWNFLDGQRGRNPWNHLERVA